MTRLHNTSFSTVFAFFLFLTIGLAGCDMGGDQGNVVGYDANDEVIEGDPNLSVRPVLDADKNRLVFKDQEHFDDFMQYMAERYAKHADLDAFESHLGFRSFRTHMEDLRDNLVESPGQDSLEYIERYHKIEALDTVEDPLFATMLNPAGEIQIGDIVHKVGK